MTSPRRRTDLVVAVDARTVYDEARRGIAKTVVGLYRALAAARPGWRFQMIHRDGREGNPFADLSNVVPVRVEMPGDRFGLWQAVRLPLVIAAARPDVFHAPAGVAPRVLPARMVATVNDLIPLDARAGEPGVAAWGRNVRRAATRARAVVTASEHARGRIVHHFGVPPEKVAVVRWGPISGPPTPPLPATAEVVRQKYGVPAGGEYVLHFGMADPRKNTARVIDAWAAVSSAVRERASLLVVGVQGPGLERFRQQVLGHRLVDSAHVHGYIPEADVAVLTAGAAAVCYPTLYEGYGLPVLDAFAAGVPVLSSNTTSIPEVAGDAGLLVDPTDTAAIAAGLTRLVLDPVLRDELVARGRVRVRDFTWERCAEQVAAVFEAVAAAKG
jgi:alpha-1,3-rhamnosyl/mannosyltransferase